jgi:hypothetical protein
VPAKTAKLRVAAEVHEIRRESPEARYRHKVECVGLLAERWSYAAADKVFHHDPATLKRWWRKASKQGELDRSTRHLVAGGLPSCRHDDWQRPRTVPPGSDTVPPERYSEAAVHIASMPLVYLTIGQ